MLEVTEEVLGGLDIEESLNNWSRILLKVINPTNDDNNDGVDDAEMSLTLDALSLSYVVLSFLILRKDELSRKSSIVRLFKVVIADNMTLLSSYEVGNGRKTIEDEL